MNSSEFAADVELLFDNALKFNEDNSPVWLAAKALRPIFHEVLAELPPEYSVSNPPPTAPSATKIRLKMGGRKKETSPTSHVPGKEQVPHQAVKSSDPSAATRQNASPSIPSSAVPTALNTNATSSTPRQVNGAQQSARYRHPPNATANPAQQPTPATPRSQTMQVTPTLTPVTPSPMVASGTPLPQPTRAPPIPPTPTPTIPVVPRSPTPDAVVTTIIRTVSLVTLPSKRRLLLQNEGLGIHHWSIRLGHNESSVQVSVEAEKERPFDLSTQNQMEVENKATSVEIEDPDGDGKIRFPAEVKCNGLLVMPLAVLAGPSSSGRSKSPDGAGMEDDGVDGNGDMKINGHDGAEGGVQSSSDVEDTMSVARATRSGQVPIQRNGKPKRRRRYKKGQSKTVVLELGRWDVSALALGPNVLDLHMGGKEGERWRIFIDRTS